MSRTKLWLSFALMIGCGRDGTTADPWGVPITGGTLLVSRDGAHAVVADADRDRIVAVDLATGKVTGELALDAGDQPGRLVEDAAGRIHVALRGGGSIATLANAATAELVELRFACSEPRGLAFDAAAGALHVACAGGELVTFPAAGGPASRAVRLERDLRDVVISNGQLLVTRFRTAEVLTIDATGAIAARTVLPTVQRSGGGFPLPPDATTGPESQPGIVDSVPTVAWRAIALPDGRVVVSHQRHTKRQLETEQPGGYGGGCGKGPVEDAITVIAGGAPRAVGSLVRGALPVDVAVSPSGDKLALVAAGNRSVVVADTAIALAGEDHDDCNPPEPDPDDCDDDKPGMGGGGGEDGDDKPVPLPEPLPPTGSGCSGDNGERELGRPTSVAFTPGGDLVVFYPERPALVVRPVVGEHRRIQLTGEPGRDLGRNVFHRQTRAGIACASCHPEGHEDGQVWQFAAALRGETFVRRTQSLAGNILERAPYHWNGEEATLDALMDDVFSRRMGGGELDPFEKQMLGPWLDRIPVPAPVVVDAAAVERGRVLFESPALACASCHNGGLLSNKQLVNVGTNGAFKVPSLLGVGARPPFMHDGCAATLRDRFTTCGGGDAHGMTSQLGAAELDDLVAYLGSL